LDKANEELAHALDKVSPSDINLRIKIATGLALVGIGRAIDRLSDTARERAEEYGA
jgi:hypothetical protein